MEKKRKAKGRGVWRREKSVEQQVHGSNGWRTVSWEGTNSLCFLTPLPEGHPRQGASFLILSPCTTWNPPNPASFNTAASRQGHSNTHPRCRRETGNNAGSTMNQNSYKIGLIVHNCKAPSQPHFQLPSMRWAPSSLNPHGLASTCSEEGSISTAGPPASTAQPHLHLEVQWGCASVEMVLGFWEDPGYSQRNNEIQGMVSTSATSKSQPFVHWQQQTEQT